VKLTFDAETEAFRQTFIDWLDANMPPEAATAERPRSTAHLPQWARDWQRTQFEAGWLVPGNPPEYGGRNATLIEQFIHHEVLATRHITDSFNPQALGIIVPSILTFGTEEQKQRWAVPILRGDMTAALGMSEPNAGSDLAGLRTKAELDGDEFVINGQKVWTSGAHDADVILTFVRTDPDAPKHKGISCILVPTDTDGVTRRPFGSFISPDDLDFNEVFFDDARVPAENLLGPLNAGWQVANGSLGHERAMLWLNYSAALDRFLEEFRGAVAATPAVDDDRLVDWYGSVAIDAQAVKLLGYRTLAKARRGMVSTEQSILKLFSSEANQDAYARAVEELGALGLDHEALSGSFHHLHLDGYMNSWFDGYLRTFAGTIAGGTSEIQRNIVAERVLGMPR
jgi:alkylation response protein AidB-like acyl-CoA dehydrogenase